MSHKKHFGDHGPKKQFFSSVKVGTKGQIVIPNEVRTMFDIHPGDTLILVAREGHAIGIVKDTTMYNFTLGVLDKLGVADKGEENSDPDEE